jgi:hypothetical protein
MPAYIHYREVEPDVPGVIVCPICLGFPLHIRDVEPCWSEAKLDFIYECSGCGAEVRETVTRPERRRGSHHSRLFEQDQRSASWDGLG